MLCVRMTGGFHWRLDPMVGDLSCLRDSVLKLAIIAESWSRVSPNAGVAVKKACKHAAMKEVITHDVKCKFFIMLTFLLLAWAFIRCWKLCQGAG